jgi:hypothetical protein
VVRGLLSQLALHAFPELWIYDWMMLARMPNLPVPDLTEVDRVGEQFVERAAAERLSAGSIALLGDPNLRDDSVTGQLVCEQTDRTESEIALRNALGKLADLLMLDGDPTISIGDFRKLSTVIQNGAIVVDNGQSVGYFLSATSYRHVGPHVVLPLPLRGG